MKKITNPPNPFTSYEPEYFDGENPLAELQIFEDRPKTILSHNDSPDLAFRWSLNPYRGCSHGCAYCYARPTHEYLGFGAGTDFDTKLVIKRQAPALLRQAFMKKTGKERWSFFREIRTAISQSKLITGLRGSVLKCVSNLETPAAS